MVTTRRLDEMISERCALRQEVKHLRAENARLREALEPFARLAEELRPSTESHVGVDMRRCELRRAAEVMKETTNAQH